MLCPLPICACWPVAELLAPSSTTPMAAPVTSSLCVGREKSSRGSSSARTCFRTCLLVDTSTVILGRPAAVPFGFAPTGFTRMMHTEGERGRRPRRRTGRHPVRVVDDGHDVDRGLGRGCPGRAAVVPALPVARPRGEPRFRGTGRRRRLRGARAHRRHPDRRATATGRAQRPDHPAVPVLEDLRGGRAASRLVVRPVHHRAARVRVAHALRGHCRRAGRPPVRPGGDDRRPRLAPLRLGRAARGQGRPQRGRRQGRRRTPERMPSSCRTTGDDSSTGPQPRWKRCPPWSMRWATGPRSMSMGASCRAATWSPRSLSGRGLSWSDGPTSTG